MSRRNAARKREVMADPIFHSELVSKLINSVMKSGKKSVAERIVYGALNKINAHDAKLALASLKKALNNASPRVEVKSRRVGGSTYQVPVEVRPDRRDAVGMRLLVSFAMKRSEKTMDVRLANEIMDASQNKGGAVKKCEDIHKLAEANKAFSHYRW